MSANLLLLGGGEHARVVADAALSRPNLFTLLGFVDPQPCADNGLVRLGDDDAVSRHPGALLCLAIGHTPLDRRRLALAARFSERAFAAVVHARAVVSPTAVVTAGAVVCAGAIVNPGARIGAHAIVNSGAIVEHDVVIGAHSHICPGAVIGGGARIDAGAFLGLGCRVRDHVHIGAHAIIAMGAVVVADVAEGSKVAGVPARLLTGV